MKSYKATCVIRDAIPRLRKYIEEEVRRAVWGAKDANAESDINADGLERAAENGDVEVGATAQDAMAVMFAAAHAQLVNANPHETLEALATGDMDVVDGHLRLLLKAVHWTRLDVDKVAELIAAHKSSALWSSDSFSDGMDILTCFSIPARRRMMRNFVDSNINKM